MTQDTDTIEPTSKFFEEFGDGDVPIKYVLGWTGAENALEWFERSHSQLDIIESLRADVDDLFEWSYQYHQLPESVANEATSGAQHNRERDQYVRLMMQAGLRLDMIARWLKVPQYVVVRSVVGETLWGRWHDVIEADEHVFFGRRKNADIVRATGLHRNTVARLREIRGEGVASTALAQELLDEQETA